MITSDGDCELGGTTILHHNPRLSPLRIIDRGGISSAAVCHTHPTNASRALGVPGGDATKSNKFNNKNAKSSRATGGGSGGLSATSAAAVVAAATTTSLATNTNDVEL